MQTRRLENGRRVVALTIPPWPGVDEARRVKDHWPARIADAASEA